MSPLVAAAAAMRVVPEHAAVAAPVRQPAVEAAEPSVPGSAARPAGTPAALCVDKPAPRAPRESAGDTVRCAAEAGTGTLASAPAACAHAAAPPPPPPAVACTADISAAAAPCVASPTPPPVPAVAQQTASAEPPLAAGVRASATAGFVTRACSGRACPCPLPSVSPTAVATAAHVWRPCTFRVQRTTRTGPQSSTLVNTPKQPVQPQRTPTTLTTKERVCGGSSTKAGPAGIPNQGALRQPGTRMRPPTKFAEKRQQARMRRVSKSVSATTHAKRSTLQVSSAGSCAWQHAADHARCDDTLPLLRWRPTGKHTAFGSRQNVQH